MKQFSILLEHFLSTIDAILKQSQNKIRACSNQILSTVVTIIANGWNLHRARARGSFWAQAIFLSSLKNTSNTDEASFVHCQNFPLVEVESVPEHGRNNSRAKSKHFSNKVQKNFEHSRNKSWARLKQLWSIIETNRSVSKQLSSLVETNLQRVWKIPRERVWDLFRAGPN